MQADKDEQIRLYATSCATDRVGYKMPYIAKKQIQIRDKTVRQS